MNSRLKRFLGALPEGRNSPQKPPLGLYTEQFSGSAFTMPRKEQRRSWLYRIRPSAAHAKFKQIERGSLNWHVGRAQS